MSAEWDEFPDSFRDRDSNVLDLIGEERLTKFSFEGVKRRLGIHSETLSRILLRLESRGLVEKNIEGYSVTWKAKNPIKPCSQSLKGQSLPILQTVLSPNVPVRNIVASMKGRWFGNLRWMGSSESEQATILKWVTEDGGVQIDAVFVEGQLTIRSKLIRERDISHAIQAAYKLMEQVAKFYLRPIRTINTAYLSNPNGSGYMYT